MILQIMKQFCASDIGCSRMMRRQARVVTLSVESTSKWPRGNFHGVTSRGLTRCLTAAQHKIVGTVGVLDKKTMYIFWVHVVFERKSSFNTNMLDKQRNLNQSEAKGELLLCTQATGCKYCSLENLSLP